MHRFVAVRDRPVPTMIWEPSTFPSSSLSNTSTDSSTKCAAASAAAAVNNDVWDERLSRIYIYTSRSLSIYKEETPFLVVAPATHTHTRDGASSTRVPTCLFLFSSSSSLFPSTAAVVITLPNPSLPINAIKTNRLTRSDSIRPVFPSQPETYLGEASHLISNRKSFVSFLPNYETTWIFFNFIHRISELGWLQKIMRPSITFFFARCVGLDFSRRRLNGPMCSRRPSALCLFLFLAPE